MRLVNEQVFPVSAYFKFPAVTESLEEDHSSIELVYKTGVQRTIYQNYEWFLKVNPRWKLKSEASFYDVGSGSQEDPHEWRFGGYEYRPKIKIVLAGNNASVDEGYLPALNPFGLSSSLENESGFIESTVINDRVLQIFRDSEHELFESGMESLFSRKLHLMIYQFGHLTLKALNDLFDNKQTNEDLLAEAMRTVGRSTDKFTEDLRFRFLVEGLNHPSPFIRDSAALGLCDMEDTRAIPFLREAIKKEKYESLKDDFEQIIEELGA